MHTLVYVAHARYCPHIHAFYLRSVLLLCSRHGLSVSCFGYFKSSLVVSTSLGTSSLSADDSAAPLAGAAPTPVSPSKAAIQTA
eukprot:6186309-Pleurochrysis_carterae.AAC.2